MFSFELLNTRQVHSPEAEGQFIWLFGASVFVAAKSQSAIVDFKADEAHERFVSVIFERVSDPFAAAKHARLPELCLVDYLHNRLRISVPSVLDNSNVVFFLEDPATAGASVRSVLAQWGPSVELGALLSDHYLHALESVIVVVDAVVYGAHAPARLPL